MEQLGQEKKGWVGRTVQLVTALLVLLVLGACEQLASAPTPQAQDEVATVTEAEKTQLSPQLTGVWGTIPMWAYSYGWAKIDLTWKTGGRGQFVLDNRSSNTYSFIQFRSGTQPWVASPEYLAPGVRKTYNWTYPGAPVSYSFRICRYLSGTNTCGQILTIRPG